MPACYKQVIPNGIQDLTGFKNLTGLKDKIREQDRAYFLTMIVVSWIDIFTRPNHKMLLQTDRIKRNKYYKVWQDGNQPKEIFSNRFLYEKLNYIHQAEHHALQTRGSEQVIPDGIQDLTGF